jgi:hypothetical protein
LALVWCSWVVCSSHRSRRKQQRRRKNEHCYRSDANHLADLETLETGVQTNLFVGYSFRPVDTHRVVVPVMAESTKEIIVIAVHTNALYSILLDPTTLRPIGSTRTKSGGGRTRNSIYYVVIVTASPSLRAGICCIAHRTVSSREFNTA